MKIEGDYTFEAPRDVVWDVLLDPQLLAKVLPGCEGLDPLGNDQYKAVLKIQIGPVQGVFEGTVSLLDINKPDSYRMDINGCSGVEKLDTTRVNLKETNCPKQ